MMRFRCASDTGRVLANGLTDRDLTAARQQRQDASANFLHRHLQWSASNAQKNVSPARWAGPRRSAYIEKPFLKAHDCRQDFDPGEFGEWAAPGALQQLWLVFAASQAGKAAE